MVLCCKKILDNTAQAQSPSSSNTCFSKHDIVEAITDNVRNNFNKVIGLPYFCGGSESSPSAPNLKCITSAHSWIVDIENRTRTNWDDEGRIELAMQYALDNALLTSIIVLSNINLIGLTSKRHF